MRPTLFSPRCLQAYFCCTLAYLSACNESGNYDEIMLLQVELNIVNPAVAVSRRSISLDLEEVSETVHIPNEVAPFTAASVLAQVRAFTLPVRSSSVVKNRVFPCFLMILAVGIAIVAYRVIRHHSRRGGETGASLSRNQLGQVVSTVTSDPYFKDNPGSEFVKPSHRSAAVDIKKNQSAKHLGVRSDRESFQARIESLTRNWGVEQVGGLPVLDTSQILHTAEARFTVRKDDLFSSVVSRLVVAGNARTPSLNVHIDLGRDGSSYLAVALPGSEDDPLACVYTDAHGSESLKVFDSNGKLFGILQPVLRESGVVLLRDGEQVLRLAISNTADFEMTAWTGIHCLAVAGCGMDGPQSSGKWSVKVRPGGDGVLIVASMLSVFFLQKQVWKSIASSSMGGDQRQSFPRLSWT